MAKKPRTRRIWTAEQVRILKKMARQRKRASQIPKRLKRSEGATRQKAFSMGLSLDARVGRNAISPAHQVNVRCDREADKVKVNRRRALVRTLAEIDA